jgi:hypothetical protein
MHGGAVIKKIARRGTSGIVDSCPCVEDAPRKKIFPPLQGGIIFRTLPDVPRPATFLTASADAPIFVLRHLFFKKPQFADRAAQAERPSAN